MLMPWNQPARKNLLMVLFRDFFQMEDLTGMQSRCSLCTWKYMSPSPHPLSDNRVGMVWLLMVGASPHPLSGNWVGMVWLLMVGAQRCWELAVQDSLLKNSLYLLIWPRLYRDKIRLKVWCGNQKNDPFPTPNTLSSLQIFSLSQFPAKSDGSELIRWQRKQVCFPVADRVHRAGLHRGQQHHPWSWRPGCGPSFATYQLWNFWQLSSPLLPPFLLLSKADNNSNITHHSQEVETSQGSAGGCTDKQNVTDPSNRDHLDLKRQEIVTRATARTNPVWFYLHEVPRAVRFIETESPGVVARGWRGEDEEPVCSGWSLSFARWRRSGDGWW